MLFDRYEKEQALFNMNFKEATTTPGFAAYRGELVLVDGEVGDAQGRRKPPIAVIRQASALAESEQIVLLSGALNEVNNIHELLAKYGPDFKAGALIVLFVVNIPKAVQFEEAGAKFFLIPMQDGMAWNELADLAALEKDDFKGQSASEKVYTVFQALGDFKPKYPVMTFAEALATRNDAKRESRGPV
jgi:hypothetical protein